MFSPEMKEVQFLGEKSLYSIPKVLFIDFAPSFLHLLSQWFNIIVDSLTNGDVLTITIYITVHG